MAGGRRPNTHCPTYLPACTSTRSRSTSRSFASSAGTSDGHGPRRPSRWHARRDVCPDTPRAASASLSAPATSDTEGAGNHGLAHLFIEHAAVGFLAEATRGRQLAEPRAVRPHGEHLVTEQTQTERIAARVEHHRSLDGVLDGIADGASGRACEGASARRRLALGEASELAQVVALRVDREELTLALSIAAEGVRGREEEHTPAIGALEHCQGVAPTEAGQLEQLPPPAQKHLLHV